MDAEQKRNRNRELMPNVAEMVDEWRKFFPGLKVIWAEDLETGHSVGTKPEPEKHVFEIPPRYEPTKQIEPKSRKERK
jgi:hypothetical protein